MGDKYETAVRTPLSDALIALLVERGYLVKVETEIYSTPQEKKIIKVVEDKPQWSNVVDKVVPMENKYLGNGLSIETNIESICREFLGMSEDRKAWIKAMREAVKEHGHDEILTSFYEWAEAQSGMFMGRKPMTTFFRDLSTNLSPTVKPQTTNPSIDKAEKQIAYITNNQVFFTGQYRIKFAQILKEHGVELVVKAFQEFWQTVDNKSIPWAGRDFLQRAGIIISTIQQKSRVEFAAKQALADAYEQAKENVDEVEEDEEL